MITKIGAFLACIVCFVISLLFARREGKKAEQIANLRRELERNAKEQAHAQNIMDNVRNMSDKQVQDKLKKINFNK